MALLTDDCVQVPPPPLFPPETCTLHSRPVRPAEQCPCEGGWRAVGGGAGPQTGHTHCLVTLALLSHDKLPNQLDGFS